MSGTRSTIATNRLRRVTALAVPVVLLGTGLAAVGPGVLSATAAPAKTSAPTPHVQVTQVVSPKAYDHPGQVLTWTSKVTNSGSTPLGRLAVTDASARLSARTCAPVGLGGTLAAGASTTCTATSTITQDDLDRHKDARDAVTASATSAQGSTADQASASATATATVSTLARLSLTATATPAAVSRVGQTVGYTFLARNKGNQTLHDLLVTAPFPGLSALVCAPVALGGALAPGATTTCRATRTVTVLGPTVRPDTAKATGRTSTGSTANAAGSVQVTTDTRPPVATDDTVGGIGNGPTVYLPGSTNDHPAEPGGPAIDPSRTVFVGFEAADENSATAVSTDHGRWLVLPDGSVQVQPFAFSPIGVDPVDEVDYRVYDTAGRSAVGHLRLDVRKPAIDPHEGESVTTLQDQPVTVDVLARADPGENADGTPSAFDRSTLTLTGVDPPRAPAITVLGPKDIQVPGIGGYTVDADGRITFTPVPTFSGSAPAIEYRVINVAGSRVLSRVGFQVTEVVPAAKAPTPSVTDPGPVATDDHTVTTPGLTAYLAGQSNDIATTSPFDNSKTHFPTDQLKRLPAGSTITNQFHTLVVAGQGTYTQDLLELDTRFDAFPGFSGETTPVDYLVADRAGRTARATLSVTVVPGILVRPDTVTTPQGRRVTVDVRANDGPRPGQVGGVPSYPGCCSTSFTQPWEAGGQAPGSTLSPEHLQLTVPGQGVYSLDPPSGAITFDPDPRFVGRASPIDLDLTVPLPVPFNGSSALLQSTLQVTVRGVEPVAHPDSATTGVGRPVVVPVLGNDSAGSAAVPLVGSGVRLRLVSGLPSGSSLDGTTKALTVPGRGVFLVAGDGSITFVPFGPAAGAPLVVGYSVADTNGTRVQSTLTVTET